MLKYIFFTLIIFINTFSSNAQEVNKQTVKYDAELAKSLGADENGMRKYVMAFLKRGPVKLTDSVERVNLQKAHMENIGRMAEMGKLIVAGPFLDKGEIRGIYIFDVQTVEEAKALTETDPAIKAGTLGMDLHPWYGSAGLMKVSEIHKAINKNQK